MALRFKGMYFSDDVKANLIQSTMTQIFLKTIETLPCWYSFVSSFWVLTDEYPCARFLVIFQLFFLHHFILVQLATSSIRVNKRKGLKCLWSLPNGSLMARSASLGVPGTSCYSLLPHSWGQFYIDDIFNPSHALATFAKAQWRKDFWKKHLLDRVAYL